MIRITNGKRETTVSKQSFDKIFSKNGWTIIESATVESKKTEPNNDDNDDIDTLKRIPIGQMTNEQKKVLANWYNIPVNGRNKKDVIDDIVKAISEDV